MLLLLVTALSSVMAQIPMVVLAAVMMIVALKTVNWHSVSPATLRHMPFSETLVMGVSVAATVWTGNLAVGVVGGVVLAIMLFTRRVEHVINAERELAADGSTVQYRVHGQLFFGRSNDLVERFEYGQDQTTVITDLPHAQIWDDSSVATLDAIVTKCQAHGAEVTITGLNARSGYFQRRLTGRLP